jgi:hypothetical protein
MLAFTCRCGSAVCAPATCRASVYHRSPAELSRSRRWRCKTVIDLLQACFPKDRATTCRFKHSHGVLSRIGMLTCSRVCFIAMCFSSGCVSIARLRGFNVARRHRVLEHESVLPGQIAVTGGRIVLSPSFTVAACTVIPAPAGHQSALRCVGGQVHECGDHW